LLVQSVAQLTLAGGVALMPALVAAGAAKGLIGVGMPIVAMPLVSHIIDVSAAVALLSIPLVLSNLRQAIKGAARRRRRASWLHFWWGSASGSWSAWRCCCRSMMPC
jgi:hypothetical protein